MTRRNEDRPLPVDLAEWDSRRARSRQAAEARAAGQLGLGPSDAGECRRKLMYVHRPPADYTPDPVDKTAAIFGTLLDEGIKKALRRRYRSRSRHFNLRVPIPGLDREAEVDDYDEALGRVRDYKSGGKWRWDRWETVGVPPDDNMWKQLRIYGLAIAATGRPVNYLELVCVERAGTSGVQPLVFREDYNEALAVEALNWLLDVAGALDAGVDMPRDLRGPGVDRLCELCPAVRHCWDLDNVPPSRSPQSWMLTRDDAAVTAALAEYDRGRTIASEGEEIKKAARAMLTGIEAGRYGDLTLRWTGGRPAKNGKPDYAADSAGLRDRLAQVREHLPILREVIALAGELTERDRQAVEELVALVSSDPVMPETFPVSRVSIEVAPIPESVRQAEAIAAPAAESAAS